MAFLVLTKKVFEVSEGNCRRVSLATVAAKFRTREDPEFATSTPPPRPRAVACAAEPATVSEPARKARATTSAEVVEFHIAASGASRVRGDAFDIPQNLRHNLRIRNRKPF